MDLSNQEVTERSFHCSTMGSGCFRSAGTQVQSPAWHSGLRVWHCRICGLGGNCGSDPIPGLGTPYVEGWLKKEKKKKKKSQRNTPRGKAALQRPWQSKQGPDANLSILVAFMGPRELREGDNASAWHSPHPGIVGNFWPLLEHMSHPDIPSWDAFFPVSAPLGP